MQILKLLLPISASPPRKSPFHLRLFASGLTRRVLDTVSQDTEMTQLVEYIDSLKNYEKRGVPKAAGTDSDEGFDLGRMRRLMGRLGDPQSKLKVIHIAGTKGKGSTAAFLSNILRAEGYKVGSYTSPHIRTIRERISVGKLGEPVPAVTLNGLFSRIKATLDESIEVENGCLSHFEVFTAIAFALFADEKVDIAVIEAGLGGARDATNIISSSELIASVITNIGEEHLDALGGTLESIAMAKAGIIKHGRPVVLGGPFLPHIEKILREKALSMSSPVVLASGSGNQSVIRGISLSESTARPSQSCDLLLQFDQDPNLSLELLDVRLSMLGVHQLQNAATASCAVLYLRNLGWEVSDASIRAGLEHTCLLGRSQFLKAEEATALGLPRSTILLDGAHTKESARTLVDMVKTSFPNAKLAVVVAMASDKDHTGFAKEFLSGTRLEAVLSTEVNIAGGGARTTSSASLRDCWVRAAEELSINTNILHDQMNGHGNLSLDQFDDTASVELDDRTVLAACNSLDTSLQLANRILERRRPRSEQGILLVTGSLHVVSSVLSSFC